MNPEDLRSLREAETRARDDVLGALAELAFTLGDGAMPMDYFDGFALLLDAYEDAIEERVRAEAEQQD